MTQIYRELLTEELKQGVVRRIAEKDVAWCNPTFIIRKKTGEGRKILDCSILNDYLQDRSFKMEDVRTITQLAEQGDWATSLDLKSAYLHVPVQEDFQPYLAFNFEGQHYCYATMPFGLKCAPRVFTVWMRKIMDRLRETLTLRCVIYMDDLLILGRTQQETAHLTEQTTLALLQFGWTISWDKCQTTPQQRINFLGWHFDFMTMTVQMTDHRRRELIDQTQTILKTALARETLPVRTLAQFLGSLNFVRLQVTDASLYTSRLNALRTRTVKTWGWDSVARLTPWINGELKWWLQTLSRNRPHKLRTDLPGATLVTDASPWGWGASLQLTGRETVRMWNTWTTDEKRLTSNHREFLAVLLALTTARQSLPKHLTIRVLSDNTTVVFNIQKWKGAARRIPALRLLRGLCQHMDWTLMTQHLPGTQNSEADALSRMGNSSEFHLNEPTWTSI
jgi:ribonuclease HI